MDASIWDQILTRIEGKVNRHSFNTWFKPTSFVADAGHSITVRVPNILFKDWLTKHYSLVLSEALGEVRRTGVALLFVADGTAIADEAVTENNAEPPVERLLRSRNRLLRAVSILVTPSMRSSWGPRTSLLTPRAARSPKHPRGRTIRSSFTAGWDLARRI